MKKNNKGFTLAELLIVVAIIAVLVAVSIPMFTSQLEKAKTSTDEANERAGKAAAVAAYLSSTDSTPATVYYYDASTGQALTSNSLTKGYGKASGNTDNVVKIEIKNNGASVETDWVKFGTEG